MSDTRARPRPRWPEPVVGGKYVRHLDGLLRALRPGDAHGNRRLHLDDVLACYLLAFFNPALRSLRTVEDFSRTRQAGPPPHRRPHPPQHPLRLQPRRRPGPARADRRDLLRGRAAGPRRPGGPRAARGAGPGPGRRRLVLRRRRRRRLGLQAARRRLRPGGPAAARRAARRPPRRRHLAAGGHLGRRRRERGRARRRGDRPRRHPRLRPRHLLLRAGRRPRGGRGPFVHRLLRRGPRAAMDRRPAGRRGNATPRPILVHPRQSRPVHRHLARLVRPRLQRRDRRCRGLGRPPAGGDHRPRHPSRSTDTPTHIALGGGTGGATPGATAPQPNGCLRVSLSRRTIPSAAGRSWARRSVAAATAWPACASWSAARASPPRAAAPPTARARRSSPCAHARPGA